MDILFLESILDSAFHFFFFFNFSASLKKSVDLGKTKKHFYLCYITSKSLKILGKKLFHKSCFLLCYHVFIVLVSGNNFFNLIKITQLQFDWD